jgi:hypothetical protein
LGIRGRPVGGYGRLPVPVEGRGREPPRWVAAAAEGERPRRLSPAESLRQKDREPEGVLESPAAVRSAPTG